MRSCSWLTVNGRELNRVPLVESAFKRVRWLASCATVLDPRLQVQCMISHLGVVAPSYTLYNQDMKFNLGHSVDQAFDRF